MASMENTLKGMMYIIGGVILLLHTLNIMRESLQYALIIGSLIMIFYGILKSGLFEKTLKLLQQKETAHKDKKSE